MRALVTAGGTREPIDDVRVVTNLSRGRFGAAIANALVEAGVQVTLLASHDLASHPEWLALGVEVVPFGSFADLEGALRRHTEVAPDLLFMVAAVSDYAPIPAEGKLRSHDEELVIRMRRNPKLLSTLRARCGVGTFLVGFKLLSRVSTGELREVAHRQVRGDRLNLTVANDMARISADEHPVLLVTPEGGARAVRGTKAQVAGELVRFCLRRHRVRWSRSEALGAEAPADEPGLDDAAALLTLAQDAGLLPGLDGNVSVRGGEGLWITPRQLPKADLDRAALVHATWREDERVVRYRGAAKPSIDTSVHACLYRRLPSLAALLHTHHGLALDAVGTGRSWPCGVQEEADEVHQALARAAARGRWDGGPFAVDLVEHGLLIGLEPGGVARLASEWAAARAAHREHLAAIGAEEDPLAPAPVFAGGRIVGVVAELTTDPARPLTVFLLPGQRGGGLGDRAAELLERRGRWVVAHERCEVAAWYVERGFRPARREGARTILEPPGRRDDLRLAASACLFDPLAKRVLLGRRKTAPWEGYWAFPGGGREGDEPLVETARRELREETGLRAPGEPAWARTVHVGAPGGQVAYALRAFVFWTLDAPDPVASDELEPRWFPLAEAQALRPMAAATRRVLRALAAGGGEDPDAG